MINRSKGFTLLEVMIAALIIFSAIAVSTLVYRGALLSSAGASNHIKINSMVPASVSVIKEQILEKSNTNESAISGEFNQFNAKVEWSANLISFRSAPAYFSTDTGEMITPEKRFKLWQVNMKISLPDKTKHYSYKEMSWRSDGF